MNEQLQVIERSDETEVELVEDWLEGSAAEPPRSDDGTTGGPGEWQWVPDPSEVDLPVPPRKRGPWPVGSPDLVKVFAWAKVLGG